MPTWETVSLQDYRLRQASYLHNDEGHRNLRRRVPFWGTWDDHDATNNCWGNSTAAGAENHQTICPVGPNASNADKAKYECDQDEGSATVRFTNAYIAYLEWVPHRWQPGTMGVITLGNINQGTLDPPPRLIVKAAEYAHRRLCTHKLWNGVTSPPWWALTQDIPIVPNSPRCIVMVRARPRHRTMSERFRSLLT